MKKTITLITLVAFICIFFVPSKKLYSQHGWGPMPDSMVTIGPMLH